MLFFILISIGFLIINSLIIFSDIKYKKIPNKYLGYLLMILIFYYFYLYFYWYNFNLTFVFQIIFSLIISFILYYFWVWSAWDAKYLLVLALFIPMLWITVFIWNIALITLIYLILFFIYFYFWRCLFNLEYTKSLYKNIYLGLKENFITYIKHTDWNIYRKTMIYKIFRWLSFFLIIFVSFRLFRLYILQHVIQTQKSSDIVASTNWWIIWFIIRFSIEHKISLLVLVILFYWSIYLFYRIINLIKIYLSKKIKSKWSIDKSIIIDIYLLSILTAILLTYIIKEYIKDPIEMSHNLKLIFTLYLIIYFIIRILIFAYKITFQLWEQDFINISKLETWDIIDIKYLMSLFWEQKCLWYKQEEWLLKPNPKEYFTQISNPIDKETKEKIINIFHIVNEYHKENKSNWFQEIKDIKILKNFSFWAYIFIWFIISYFLWNKIFDTLIKLLFDYLKIKH